MINYSGLPSRVRRIVKVYDYCIDSVVTHKDGRFSFRLKEGYKINSNGTLTESHLEGFTVLNMEDAIYFLKSIVKPSNREIKVALYGFTCPISGVYVPKGSNYIELGGLKVSPTCDIGD